MMLAVRYHGPRKPLVVERVPVPSPGSGEALVRVRAAGVCRTELHFLDGLLDLGIAPLILGHEIVGDVVGLGPGADGVKPGDRVLVGYYATCGRCRWCRTARENLCPQPVAQLGFTADGGYAALLQHGDTGDVRGGVEASWAILGRRPEDFGEMASDSRWTEARLEPEPRVGVWTDDFHNLLSVFKW